MPKLLIGLTVLLSCTPALAAEAILDVPRVETPPVVDGILGDAAWNGALVVDDFVARLPVDGAAPTERTEVLIVHTARALYVGVRAFDAQPATIRAAALRRDDFALTGGDQFVIAIDSFRDLRNGYWFSTNPAGVRVDAQFADEGERFEDSWNGVWDAAARIDGLGWTAELRIPWSTLRFRAGDDVVMGINLFRRLPRVHEQLFAPAVPLTHAFGTPNVSVARPYRFHGIAGGARAELRPFALARRNHGLDAADPRRDDEEIGGGLFLRVPLGDAATLSATWRADFSEVEVDEARLNLTRFPLFLPEKRDFFLEDSGLFAFGAPGEAELFFSRTIGFLLDAEGRATTTDIDWGVKGSARHRRLELGALAARTHDAGGLSGETFVVARTRLATARRGSIGALWSRREGSGQERTTAGVDANHVLPGELLLRGFLARTGDDGRRNDAWHGALSRGGERAAFTLSALSLDPDFLPAVGLVARPGTLRTEASGTLPWFPPEPSRVRRWAPSLSWVRYDDRQGDGRDDRMVAGFGAALRSEHRATLEVEHQREQLPFGFAIFRDVVVPAGNYERWEGRLSLASNPTRPLAGSLDLRQGDLYGGDHLYTAAELSWRPGPQLVLGPFLIVDRVDLPGGSFTAAVARARLGITPTAHWSFDLIGQYESETRATGGGLRARWEPREGTRVVLAWDRIELRPPLRAPHEPEHRREDLAALKVSYLLLF